MDQKKTLEHYNLKSGDMLVYKEKTRPLRVKTLDGSVKTLLIDDSQTVAELTKVVCARIGELTTFSACYNITCPFLLCYLTSVWVHTRLVL